MQTHMTNRNACWARLK